MSLLDYVLKEYEKLEKTSQFRKFVEECDGMSVEDLAEEFDIDLEIFTRIFTQK